MNVIKGLKIVCCLIIVFVQTGVFAQINYVDSLNNILHSADDKEKVSILNELANHCRYSNSQQAIDYYRQAFDICSKIDDKSNSLFLSKTIASLYFNQANFNQAKEYYNKSIQMGLSGSALAEVQIQLGNISLAQGILTAATEQYFSALKYYEKSKDENAKLNVYSNLANVFERQNNFSKAIEYNIKALSIYEQNKNKFRLLSSYDNIGNIYLRQKNYSKAVLFFMKSLKVYREIKNTAGEAATLHNLAKAHYEHKQYDKALAYAKQSLKLAQGLNIKPLLTSNYNVLGYILTAKSEYSAADSYFKKAIGISKSTGLNIELNIAYEGLEALYKATNEKGKSITFQSLSNDMKDSLYNDSILKRMNTLEADYEAKSKQSEIELLKSESALNNLQRQEEKRIRNFLLTFSALLLTLFAIVVYFFIKNKRIANALEKQNKEIIIQKEQLTQLNNVKDRFFSIISHDLRNNLTSMKLYFELISNKNYKPSDEKHLTGEIAGSVSNTIDLLENLLVWASEQIKGNTINIVKLNMYDIANDNVALLSGNASQKSIELENLVDDDSFAYGDIDTINLVVRNLISNAIKFTHEGGSVSISSQIKEGFIHISVLDNGVGISIDKIPLLFTQYKNNSTKGTGNEKGTGLGLMLCKEYVEKNKGQIWVESVQGKGSCFLFSLPLQHQN
jgi:signal transduction histidine kinase